MDWTDLRARCTRRVERLLKATDLPNPWDVADFRDRLERHLGRDIDLVPVPWTPGDSTGAWLRREDYDLIGYAANTSTVHQDHIIVHEIGHLISEHRGRCVLSANQAHERAPHLAPAAFAHLLDRVSVEAEEHEAETIAMLIRTRVVRQTRRTPADTRALDEDTSAALNRVAAAFDDP